MKQIDHLKVGQGVRFRNQKWAVTDKTEYVESVDYRETQWTLVASGGRTAYLIQSDEHTDHGPERIWVFSRPVPLESVRYQRPNGDWMQFEECGSLGSPPAKASLGEAVFTLQGQTSGLARDDDGNMVTKLTWDYYDPSGARNLAIEVWKEEDGDYPEAYDGESIAPDEVEILDAKEVGDLRRLATADWKGLGQIFWVGGIGLFLACSAGIPLDVCLAIAVPVIAGIRIFNKGNVLVALVPLVTVLIIGVVMGLLGGSASFWAIAALALALGLAVPYSMSLLGVKGEVASWEEMAWCFLPALWLVSFYIYFRYAPGPRDFAQLWAAIILPLALSAVICLVHYSLGKIWPNSE